MASLEFFHPNRIALSREVRNHTELIERLQNHRQEDFEILLAEIANYCEVILHGDYTQADLDELCGILEKKLIRKRCPIYIP